MHLKTILLAVANLMAISAFSQGQEFIDSIRQRLYTTAGQDQVRAFYDITNGFMSNQVDSSEYYAHKGLAIFQENQDTFGITIMIGQLAISAHRRGNLHQAITYNRQNLVYDIARNDLRRVAYNYSNMGLYHRQLADFDSSQYYFLKALKIHEDNNGDAGVAKTKISIGNLKANMEEYETAIEYFQDAVDFFRSNDGDPTLFYNNQYYLADALNNIAGCYVNIGRDEEALTLIEESLAIIDELQIESSKVFRYGNFATAYKNLGQYEKAAMYYTKTTETAHATGDTMSLIETWKNIGDMYYDGKKFKKVESPVKKALIIARKLDLLPIQRDCYELLYKSSEKLGRYKQSLKYRDEYDIIRDSISNLETKVEVEKLEEEYQNKKLAADLELEETKSKEKSYFIAGIGSLLVLSLGFLFIIIRNNKSLKKANELIESLKNEQAHRFSNNLSQLTSIINLKDQSDDPESITFIKENESRIESVKSLNKLLRPNADGKLFIDLDKYIGDMVDSFKNIYRGVTDSDVSYDLNLSDLEVSANSAGNIGLLVNEIITNAYKHAFSKTETPKISINLSDDQSGIKLEISDNGIGFQKNKIDDGRMGLKLIDALVNNIGAISNRTSENGTNYTISIPKHSV